MRIRQAVSRPMTPVVSCSGLKDPCTRLVVSWDSSLTACVLPARTVPAAFDGEVDAQGDGDGDAGDTGTGDTAVGATAVGRGCCCRCARAGDTRCGAGGAGGGCGCTGCAGCGAGGVGCTTGRACCGASCVGCAGCADGAGGSAGWATFAAGRRGGCAGVDGPLVPTMQTMVAPCASVTLVLFSSSTEVV